MARSLLESIDSGVLKLLGLLAAAAAAGYGAHAAVLALTHHDVLPHAQVSELKAAKSAAAKDALDLRSENLDLRKSLEEAGKQAPLLKLYGPSIEAYQSFSVEFPAEVNPLKALETAKRSLVGRCASTDYCFEVAGPWVQQTALGPQFFLAVWSPRRSKLAAPAPLLVGGPIIVGPTARLEGLEGSLTLAIEQVEWREVESGRAVKHLRAGIAVVPGVNTSEELRCVPLVDPGVLCIDPARGLQ